MLKTWHSISSDILISNIFAVMTFQTIYSPICIWWRDLRLRYQNVFTSHWMPCKFIQWYREVGVGNVILPCQDVTFKSLQKNTKKHLMLVHRYKLSYWRYLNVNKCNKLGSPALSQYPFTTFARPWRLELNCPHFSEELNTENWCK